MVRFCVACEVRSLVSVAQNKRRSDRSIKAQAAGEELGWQDWMGGALVAGTGRYGQLGS